MEAEAKAHFEAGPRRDVAEDRFADAVVALVQRVREARRAERERCVAVLRQRAEELKYDTEPEAAFWEAVQILEALPEP
jgi:hypothetical protein